MYIDHCLVLFVCGIMVFSPTFRILGGTKQLKLPPWGSDMCLMDYAPLVHQLLDEKVQSLVQSYVQRKEFTAAFLSVFGQAVLEYDTEDFKILAFLFEHSGFTFIAKCKQNYPILRSMS